MITSVLSDFCRVLIFPKDKSYLGKLNPLHKEYMATMGEDYPALDYFEFNMEFVEYLESLRGQYALNMFTTDIIQEHKDIRPQLEKWFDSIHASNDYGVKKRNPEAFPLIAQKLGRSIDSILFIDDTQENIVAAHESGMTAILFLSTEQAIRDMNVALQSK